MSTIVQKHTQRGTGEIASPPSPPSLPKLPKNHLRFKGGMIRPRSALRGCPLVLWGRSRRVNGFLRRTDGGPAGATRLGATWRDYWPIPQGAVDQGWAPGDWASVRRDEMTQAVGDLTRCAPAQRVELEQTLACQCVGHQGLCVRILRGCADRLESIGHARGQVFGHRRGGKLGERLRALVFRQRGGRRCAVYELLGL